MNNTNAVAVMSQAAPPVSIEVLLSITPGWSTARPETVGVWFLRVDRTRKINGVFRAYFE
jgi:hypothetical protein